MNQAEKERWMRRVFQLAKMGAAKVSPNPLVGCVVVHPEFGLIGEGWHEVFGGPHAEVNALASVAQPELLRESTVLVNLEPCAHFGKTPPCCDLLITKGLKEVIICNHDPNPLVAGKGILALENAGIRVECGILEKEGRELNRFFFTAQEKRRPFITLKWAQSDDGFLAPEDGLPVWISSEQSRLMVHRMRGAHHAIMAGRNTLRNDNPKLTLRNWPGRQPVRVVSDPELSLPENLAIFQDSSSPVWIFNGQKDLEDGHLRFIQMENADAVPEILNYLFLNGIHSLLVEGGSLLLSLFLEAGLWDEALVFKGNSPFNRGIPAPKILPEYFSFSRHCGPDLLSVFRHAS